MVKRKHACIRVIFILFLIYWTSKEECNCNKGKIIIWCLNIENCLSSKKLRFTNVVRRIWYYLFAFSFIDWHVHDACLIFPAKILSYILPVKIYLTFTFIRIFASKLIGFIYIIDKQLQASTIFFTTKKSFHYSNKKQFE